MFYLLLNLLFLTIVIFYAIFIISTYIIIAYLSNKYYSCYQGIYTTLTVALLNKSVLKLFILRYFILDIIFQKTTFI